jgi:hypothetical protein
MITKWRDIVIPVNSENDLDGIVVGYRLFPNNVACLTEPYAQESNPYFNAFDMPQGDDPLSSDVASGYDHGQADNMMSKMVIYVYYKSGGSGGGDYMLLHAVFIYIEKT